MSVFFTSDPHLGHRAVAYARKFGHWPEDRTKATPELAAWHDQMLAERWDAVVSSADVVWVLGDLTVNSKNVAEALTWFERRPGTKHLVLGNHDPAHPMHKDAHKWQKAYFRAFESVQTAARRTIPLPAGGRETVLLSHFPYIGDSAGKADRETQWRLPNEGHSLLHGHTHTKGRLTYGNSLPADDGGWFRPKQVHVGLDAWDYTPVSLEQVGELLSPTS